MPNATKTFQCWRVDDTSANEISMFWLNFFNFRYHWRVDYTSAIKSLNHLLQVIFDVWRVLHTSVANILCFSLLPDVCLTRQWYAFFLTDMWGHVTEANFLYWRVSHTSVHAKCEKNAAWRVAHTSMQYSLSHWRVVHTSLKRISSTDVSTTRQCLRISQKSCFFVPLTCGLHVSETIG